MGSDLPEYPCGTTLMQFPYPPPPGEMPLPSQSEQFILYLALVAILTALLSSASCSRLHLHSCPTDWGIRMASEQASF